MNGGSRGGGIGVGGLLVVGQLVEWTLDSGHLADDNNNAGKNAQFNTDSMGEERHSYTDIPNRVAKCHSTPVSSETITYFTMQDPLRLRNRIQPFS